jgi:hypothetical protein
MMVSGQTSDEEEERRTTLTSEIIDAGGTSVAMMADNVPNESRPFEMNAEAREVTAGNTATARTTEQGTGGDAASAVSTPASFQSARSDCVDD